MTRYICANCELEFSIEHELCNPQCPRCAGPTFELKETPGTEEAIEERLVVLTGANVPDNTSLGLDAPVTE